MSVVGFDIGNETCYIAIARSGGIEVIDNEYSSRMTPSYVGFSEKSRILGVAARLKLTANINNTIFSFKTILGKKFSDALNDLQYLSYDVRELPSDELGIVVKYLNKEAVFSVQQVMAMMLTKLKDLAESKLGSKVRECVISVPMFYTDMQRRTMLDAAEVAGLKVIKLMNEPTAIALSYGFYKQHAFDQPKTVVFIDLGQSALTVTAGVFIRDKLTILGSTWNKTVGGRDFDGVLVKYFAEEFKTKYKLDVMSSKKAVMMLMLECEALKKQMSMDSRKLSLNIECFMNDIDVCGKMKKDLFEQLSSHLLLGIENTMRDLLSQIELDRNDVHEVQIVGGSCRLPALRNIIFRVFGQYPHVTLNQDEAVARGCALQCAFLSPTLRTKEYIIDDIQPFKIAVSTCPKTSISNEGFEVEIFTRFHKAPSCKKITYNFKNSFFLKAFYSDELQGKSVIGKYHFSDFPSDLKIGSDVRLKLIMALDVNGIFNVTSATLQVKEIPDEQDVLSKQMAIVPSDVNYAQTNEKDMQGDDSSEMQSDSKEEESEKEIPIDVIKYFDLTIQADIPSLSKFDLNQLIEKEREMIIADLNEKKMADLRNIVEEYVYHSREKLSEELREFVPDVVRSKIFAILEETEAWLYNCDNPQEDDYSQKLDELKSYFEPVWEKFQQLADAKLALNEFKNVLGSNLAQIRILSLKGKDFPVDDKVIGNLEKLWNQKNECFNHCHKVLHGTNFPDELPIKTDAIREEIYEFKSKVDSIINKPVSKVVLDENTIIGDQLSDPCSFSGESANLNSNNEVKEGHKLSDAETSSEGQLPTEEQFSGVKIA